MKPLILFTLRDLNVSGGGAIRINSLIEILNTSREIKVFSNTDKLLEVNHCRVDVSFTNFEKKVFQLLLTFLPVFIVSIVFKLKLRKIESIFKYKINKDSDIVFCEYLDTSLGYYLLKRGLINKYVNDIHGISTLELKYKSFSSRFLKMISLFIAKKHDENVLSAASGYVFVSSSMRNYFCSMYPVFNNKKSYIVPNLASSASLSSIFDPQFLGKIASEYGINLHHPIIFFAGGYKDLGGVHDLIYVFSKLKVNYPNIQLVLIGDGFNQQSVDSLIHRLSVEDDVFQLGRQPYSKLFSLQKMASVIVCPDKENEYSNLIVHLKYFDSIASNKPVVCAGFESVKEINKIGNFAQLYKPSDLFSMEEKIIYCLDNNKSLVKNSQLNRDIMTETLTYNNFKDIIIAISA